MNIATGQTLGSALCQALGIDAKLVTNITLECDPQRAARVLVESLVPDAATGDLQAAVAEYELHPVDAGQPEPTELW